MFVNAYMFFCFLHMVMGNMYNQNGDFVYLVIHIYIQAFHYLIICKRRCSTIALVDFHSRFSLVFFGENFYTNGTKI